MIKMTKARALEIQAQQIAWYQSGHPEIDVAKIVAAHTTADELPDGEHDIVTINRHIPRGGWIESLIGINHSDLD